MVGRKGEREGRGGERSEGEVRVWREREKDWGGGGGGQVP